MVIASTMPVPASIAKPLALNRAQMYNWCHNRVMCIHANIEQSMPRNPHQIDYNVGLRLKMRRKMLSLSQEELGRRLGITFQQIQKYERGANRISASTLYHLAKLLDVPVSFFFDDQDPVRAAAVPDGFLTAPESVVDPQSRRLKQGPWWRRFLLSRIWR
jgi:transcriptional regulator with XRE-family HTH domain